MQQVYAQVASLFANNINDVFTSEDTLKAEFSKRLGGLEFTRTDHWMNILHGMLRDAWFSVVEIKAEPTRYDCDQILRELQTYLDYNLFTQVLLNLQSYQGVYYRTGDAGAQLQDMQQKWEERGGTLNPFAPKAKMLKTATTDIEREYNHALSTQRALKIVAGFTPLISFRVSPKGSTPAFSDSNNISMLGIGGDQFLTAKQVFYICWEMAAQVTFFKGNGNFVATDIPYEFTSKSGGEVLSDCLFARFVMSFIYKNTTDSVLIPRMQSVMVVTKDSREEFLKVCATLWKKYPVFQVFEGTRDSEPLKLETSPAAAS
jgi:hypothetical protein